MEAEHFIELHDKPFEFGHNPFKADIAGKEVAFEGIELEDTLSLIPDISSLRTASWLKNEAFVIADIQNAEYAPRNILKNFLVAAESPIREA